MIIRRENLWLAIRKQIAIDRELIISTGWNTATLPRIVVYGRGVSLYSLAIKKPAYNLGARRWL